MPAPSPAGHTSHAPAPGPPQERSRAAPSRGSSARRAVRACVATARLRVRCTLRCCVREQAVQSGRRSASTPAARRALCAATSCAATGCETSAEVKAASNPSRSGGGNRSRTGRRHSAQLPMNAAWERRLNVPMPQPPWCKGKATCRLVNASSSWQLGVRPNTPPRAYKDPLLIKFVSGAPGV